MSTANKFRHRLRKICVFAIVVSSVLTSQAQTSQRFLLGRILDDSLKPVSMATITLRTLADSPRITAADSTGVFTFRNIAIGRYTLTSSAVGFATRTDTIDVLPTDDTIRLKPITLHHFVRQAQEVVVTARQSPVDIKEDRVTLNVSKSINAIGSNALELLQKIPGVRVYNEEILVNGKNGITVYQDGRNVHLTGKDLISYLRNISAANISTVDLILNPPAKYDAAGNAGVIEIRLKNSDGFGTSGNFSVVPKISSYRPKLDVSANLFHRTRKTNLYLNINYSTGDYRSVNNYDRTQADQNNNQVHYDQLYYNYSYIDILTIKAGGDVSLSKTSKIGLLANVNLNTNNVTISSRTDIYRQKNNIDSFLIGDNYAPQELKRFNYDAYFLHSDSKGRQISIDGSFGIFRLPSSTDQSNTYYYPDGTYSRTVNYLNTSNTFIKSAALRADYQKKFKTGTFGAGIKASWVNSDNGLYVYKKLTIFPELDTAGTTTFFYREQIQAAYLDYKTSWKKWSLQVGLRAEAVQTSSLLSDLDHNSLQDVSYRYVNLFPSLAISRTLDENNSISLFGSRRIDRPNYRNLNSFIFVLDDLSFQNGNPFLQPQYTTELKLVHNFKQRVFTSVSYSTISDQIFTYRDTIQITKTIESKINIDKKTILNLSASTKFRLSNWWDLNMTISAFNHRVTGYANQSYLDISQTSWSINASNLMKIARKYNLEISGFYNSKYLDAPAKINAQWSIDFGIDRSVLKDKGNLKLSLSDVFMSYSFILNRQFGGLAYFNKATWESRQLKLAFVYRFGNTNIKAAANRESSLEDERKRIR